MLRREDSFGYLVNMLARLFARGLDRRLAGYGLSHGQFPALLMLWNQPGLTQGEIAQRVCVEQPTMANTLNRMEREGLIERHPDADDRRRVLVYPSQRAMALRDEVLAQAIATNAAATEGLEEHEKALAQDLLRRMIGNLERDVGAYTGAGRD
ncbi:MAG: MarR family transcriptional regulator [Magnetospirillum sp.]|nr:MarR family transcriptional regulator [Magnetospirillum sp.]